MKSVLWVTSCIVLCTPFVRAIEEAQHYRYYEDEGNYDGQEIHVDFDEYHPRQKEYVPPPTRTSAYVMEQTVAMVTYNHRHMVDCQLFDVGTRRERDQLLDELQLPTTNVELDEMVRMVDSCQHVTPSKRHARSRQSSAQYFNVFSGIMPGTKWCGHKNVARHYNDLGSNTAVDKCCRAHDYCPLKIQPLTRRYSLFNFGFYTKSHCMCDSMFYRCLKQTGNNVATIVGNIFFNIIQVKCIKEKYSQTCLQERVLTSGEHICEKWGYRDDHHRALHVITPSVTY